MGTQDKRFRKLRPINESYERKRVELQTKLDNEKNILERKKLGQFATPPRLADEIIAIGLCFHDKDDISFLDPAFGTGAFYSALVRNRSNKKQITAKGIEIDPYYGLPAKKIWGKIGLNMQIADFTTLCPDMEYNFIICNPPYVRHQMIDIQQKSRIKDKTEKITGIKMSGLAGLYCHFLLQSYQWMENDGIGAWLIPGDFLYVNYGSELKQFLLNNVKLLRFHLFDPNDLQFDDVLVSSVVVWFKKCKPEPGDNVEFTCGSSLTKPGLRKMISRETLEKETRWARFPALGERIRYDENIYLSDYFDVKRGIATGGNDFFILSKAKIYELGLPLECFRPVLPSSRYVQGNEILSDADGNPILLQQLFLLDCRLEEAEIIEKYPRLWTYIESGKAKVSKGYLCKMRKCWYHQERREAPLYVCTYMGRDDTSSGKVFRFIINNSNAVVTNSYLALYPKNGIEEEVKRNFGLRRGIWRLLNDIEPKRLLEASRIYGGGLRKVEPKELSRIPIPQMAKIISDVIGMRF